MRAALLAAVLLALGAAPAAAAPGLVKVGDFTAPVHIASPPNDPRVFVVEQAGRVRIAGGGTFLDVSDRTAGGGERGLLSIAFAPDYAASGRFYVFYTARENGSLRVVEYRRSATDPNRADPASARPVLSIPHPEAGNHNGGQLAFGPDGRLYVGTGDGGNGNDTPISDAENPRSLLGKILRIAPSGVVPAGNPFGTAVWAYGLRNPWRFSFDRATGDLVIGDVGQGAREEIDFAPAASGGGRGLNFGWRCFEGTILTPGAGGPLCAAGERPTNATPPVLDLAHSAGFASITGGVVVRDPGLPSLHGRYVYGDLAKPRLRSAVLAPGAASGDREEASLGVSQPTSFGEDACGRVYVASYGGPVYRLQDGAPTPCTPSPPSGPGTPGLPGSPGTPADTARPRLSVHVRGLGKAPRRRYVRLGVRCDEACRVTARGRLRGVGGLHTVRRGLAAGTRTTVRVKMSRRTARQLRGTLRRRSRVIVALSIGARDADGNTRRVSRRARIRA